MPIEDSKLIEYTLGLMEPSEHQALEQAIADDPDGDSRLFKAREFVVKIGAIEPPVKPSAGLRERLLASVAAESSSRFYGFEARLARFLGLGRTQIRELLTHVATDSKWERGRLPGLREQTVAAGARWGSSKVAMIAMDPGTVVPSHRHLGEEWGFVLQGTAIENKSRLYLPGDMVYKTPGSTHTFGAIGDELCIFVVVMPDVEWG